MKIIPFVLLLSPCLLFGQNYKTIHGKVIDAKSKEALAFVHVGMPNQGIGTVSNEIGVFQFHFPDYYQNETIVFSHLGYEEYLINPTNIKADTLIIELNESINNLSTVEVMGTKEPLEFYLKKAAENIQNNYPTAFFALKAFYRELKINAGDETYTRLIEAAIDIEDKGYHKESLTGIKVRLNELRKSDDHTNYTASHFSVEAKNNERNKIYDLFRINTIRNYLPSYAKSNTGLFGFELILKEAIELSLAGINYLGEEKIYAIAYKGNFVSGVIHISALDYGIHRIEQKLDWPKDAKLSSEEKESRLLERVQVNGKSLLSTLINFRKINGKYYPSFMQQWSPDDIVYSKAMPDKNAFSYANRILVVNDVFPLKKDYKKRKKGRIASRTIDLYRVKARYQPDFWKNYNLLTLRPMKQKAKSDLSVQRTLEEQFTANGN